MMCRLLIFLGLMWGAGVWAEEVFLPGVDDIPVMPGMVADDAASVSFDAPAGQIVQVVLIGQQASWDQARDFYDATLSELGWQKESDALYRRQADTFAMRVLSEKPLSVQFDISLMNEE